MFNENAGENLKSRTDFECDVFRKQETPQPGWIFNPAGAPAEIQGNLMVIESRGHGLWLCLKLSMSVQNLAAFDVIVDDDEAPGVGFPFLVECWNSIAFHEEDMGGIFFDSKISSELLETMLGLHRAFQISSRVPEEFRRQTGRFLPEEGETIYEFRQSEIAVVEQMICKYHYRK